MTRTANKNQATEAVEAAKPPALRWTIGVKKRKGKGGSKRASARAGADSRAVRSICLTCAASARTLWTHSRSNFGSAITQ
jgi:hypothetical protein